MSKRLVIPPNIMEYIEYNHVNGSFIVTKKRAARDVVGNSPVNKCPSSGYGRIVFKKKLYLAHRVAWFMYYKKQPPVQVDHINGDINNNSISNLKAADSFINNRNRKLSKKNSTGKTGVKKMPNGMYGAYINHRNKSIWLGQYNTLSEAIVKRKEAEVKYFKQISRG